MLFTLVFSYSYAQSQIGFQGWTDAESAQQYAKWALLAIEENRWSEALAGLERAADFANVSSDISYLLAAARSHEGKDRLSVIKALDNAIEINRWTENCEGEALQLKAQQLIAMRKFKEALACLDQIKDDTGLGIFTTFNVLACDTAPILRLMAFRGMALGFGYTSAMDSASALVSFRNFMFSVMDRFPHDVRPLKIFLEYARSRIPPPAGAGTRLYAPPELPQEDLALVELVLRRLPFLLEADPELAWMAAPFIHSADEARRLVASYRAGGLYQIKARDFSPHPGSIAAALNLGLIDDAQAVDELFSGGRSFNYPLPPGIAANGNPVIDKDTVMNVYELLRSEQGRDLFTQKLLSFSGTIVCDDDNDGYIDGICRFQSGIICEYSIDKNQENNFNFQISFSPDGVPALAMVPVTGYSSQASVSWDRYPSVGRIILEKEKFTFRPADFQFTPVSFTTLGGSANYSGIIFPCASNQTELTRRSMVSFCASITRPSVEFDGVDEVIFLERGIPGQAVEMLNGKPVSITEFENGAPVIQYIDLDLDGRMETIRSFHKPGPDYLWPDSDLAFNYRLLIASSESDLTGEGRYKTGEAYLQDGSVVYFWDIDGGGIMNYSETKNGNK